MKDQISVSDNSKISLPVRNLLAVLAATAFGIIAYTEITSRLNSLENSRTIMEADLITKSDQKIVDQEQFLFITGEVDRADAPFEPCNLLRLAAMDQIEGP